MLWLLFLGSFITGLVIPVLDFNYFYQHGSNKWWYTYFVGLYVLLPIGWSFTLIGTSLQRVSIVCSVLTGLGGLLMGYSVTGFLYTGLDLDKGETWVAPGIVVKTLHWYILHLVLLCVSGLMVLGGGLCV